MNHCWEIILECQLFPIMECENPVWKGCCPILGFTNWTMKMHHLRYHDFRLPRPCLVIPPHNCLTCERFHPNFRKIGKLLIFCVFFSKSLAIFALCDYRPEERLATIRHTHLYSPTSTLKHVAGSKNNSSSPATYLPRVQRAANVDCLGTPGDAPVC